MNVLDRAREKLGSWNPTDEQRERLRLAGYISYTAVLTIFFGWLLLPREAITRTVMSKFSAALHTEVRASEVSLAGLSGLEFENLEVDRDGGFTIEIPRQRIALAPLSWLFGDLKVDTLTRTAEGEARVRLGHEKEKALSLSAALTKFTPAVFFNTEADDRFSISGTVDGTLSYSAPAVPQLTAQSLQTRLADPTGAQAELDLALRGGTVKGISVSGFPVPPLRYDEANIALVLHDGKLSVRTFKFLGPDADITINGDLTVATPLSRSRLNLDVRLTPHGEFKQTYGALLPTRMRRESDGSFRASVQGPVTAPQMK